MNGLTIALLVEGGEDAALADVDAVSDATTFGPALIIVN